MFKKIKYSNGKRAIYIGKYKIFEYINKIAFADYMCNMQNKIATFDMLLHEMHKNTLIQGIQERERENRI